MRELRVKRIYPYHDTHCGGPAPEPFLALVDEQGTIVAVRKSGVPYEYDTHLAGKPDSMEYWEFR